MESEKDYDYHGGKCTPSENFLCSGCGYESRWRGGRGRRSRMIVMFDPRTQDGDYYDERAV